MAGIVRSTIELHRNGASLKQAMAAASRTLGLSVRRVRAYRHNEVRLVPAHEADGLRALYRAVLEARQRRLSAELEELSALVRRHGPR
jgi:hypothetical protein